MTKTDKRADRKASFKAVLEALVCCEIDSEKGMDKQTVGCRHWTTITDTHKWQVVQFIHSFTIF